MSALREQRQQQNAHYRRARDLLGPEAEELERLQEAIRLVLFSGARDIQASLSLHRLAELFGGMWSPVKLVVTVSR